MTVVEQNFFRQTHISFQSFTRQNRTNIIDNFSIPSSAIIRVIFTFNKDIFCSIPGNPNSLLHRYIFALKALIIRT